MLKIEVITTELKTGAKNTMTIDHDDRDERVWLGRHCFWAMRNGRAVETRPVAIAAAE